jgi:hypothetical protein
MKINPQEDNKHKLVIEDRKSCEQMECDANQQKYQSWRMRKKTYPHLSKHKQCKWKQYTDKRRQKI